MMCFGITKCYSVFGRISGDPRRVSAQIAAESSGDLLLISNRIETLPTLSSRYIE